MQRTPTVQLTLARLLRSFGHDDAADSGSPVTPTHMKQKQTQRCLAKLSELRCRNLARYHHCSCLLIGLACSAFLIRSLFDLSPAAVPACSHKRQIRLFCLSRRLCTSALQLNSSSNMSSNSYTSTCTLYPLPMSRCSEMPAVPISDSCSRDT